MGKWYIASVSFGKDSLAMLMELIRRDYPLDEVMFYDTGMEFCTIYRLRTEVYRILESKGIKFKELSPKDPFEWTMFEKPVNEGKENFHYGYSWCGGRCRWGTTEKLKAMDKYAESKDAIVYIGIAADEQKRIDKKRKSYKRLPLVDWGMTESDCLEYCYKHGFRWLEKPGVDLYQILDRVSCWCCGNKNLKELKAIYTHLPEYWEDLKRLQDKTDRPMKNYKSGGNVHQLERRFMEEVKE